MECDVNQLPVGQAGNKDGGVGWVPLKHLDIIKSNFLRSPIGSFRNQTWWNFWFLCPTVTSSGARSKSWGRWFWNLLTTKLLFPRILLNYEYEWTWVRVVGHLGVDEVPGAPHHQVVRRQDPLRMVIGHVKGRNVSFGLNSYINLREVVNVLVIVKIVHAGHPNLRNWKCKEGNLTTTTIFTNIIFFTKNVKHSHNLCSWLLVSPHGQAWGATEHPSLFSSAKTPSMRTCHWGSQSKEKLVNHFGLSPFWSWNRSWWHKGFRYMTKNIGKGLKMIKKPFTRSERLSCSMSRVSTFKWN